MGFIRISKTEVSFKLVVNNIFSFSVLQSKHSGRLYMWVKMNAQCFYEIETYHRQYSADRPNRSYLPRLNTHGKNPERILCLLRVLFSKQQMHYYYFNFHVPFTCLSFSRETELLQEKRDHAASLRVRNVNSNWFKINVKFTLNRFLISDSIRSFKSIKKPSFQQINFSVLALLAKAEFFFQLSLLYLNNYANIS